MKFIKLIFVLASILALAGLTVATERRRHMKRNPLSEVEKKDLENYLKLANKDCKKGVTEKGVTEKGVTEKGVAKKLAKEVKDLLSRPKQKPEIIEQIRNAFEELKKSHNCKDLKTFKSSLEATLVKP